MYVGMETRVRGYECPWVWAELFCFSALLVSVSAFIPCEARCYFFCVAYLPNADVFTTALGSKGNMKICDTSCRKKNTRKHKVNEIFFVLLHPE